MEKSDTVRQLEVVLEALYLDRPEASRELVKMIDLLDQIGKNYNNNLQELDDILEKALVAMEYNDTALLCDVLEYRLLPFFKGTSGV